MANSEKLTFLFLLFSLLIPYIAPGKVQPDGVVPAPVLDIVDYVGDLSEVQHAIVAELRDHGFAEIDERTAKPVLSAIGKAALRPMRTVSEIRPFSSAGQNFHWSIKAVSS